MTKQEILDLPIGKHLATDALGQVYPIEVGEQATFIQFGNQRVYTKDEYIGLLVGSIELAGRVTDYTFQSLTLIK